jgi:hypothetical protein
MRLTAMLSVLLVVILFAVGVAIELRWPRR